jgi:hypothetical protein
VCVGGHRFVVACGVKVDMRIWAVTKRTSVDSKNGEYK